MTIMWIRMNGLTLPTKAEARKLFGNIENFCLNRYPISPGLAGRQRDTPCQKTACSQNKGIYKSKI